MLNLHELWQSSPKNKRSEYAAITINRLWREIFTLFYASSRYGWLQTSSELWFFWNIDSLVFWNTNKGLSRKSSWTKTNIWAVNSGPHGSWWWRSSEAQICLIRNNINPTRPFYEAGCPQAHHAHDSVFTASSCALFCDDCIFMCVLVCNVAVDYITPLWFFNYRSDRPAGGNDLWAPGSAFWLLGRSVNQFDFGCLSGAACIYTQLKQEGVCSPCEVFWLWLTAPRLPVPRAEPSLILDMLIPGWWRRIIKQFLCQQPRMMLQICCIWKECRFL